MKQMDTYTSVYLQYTLTNTLSALSTTKEKNIYKVLILGVEGVHIFSVMNYVDILTNCYLVLNFVSWSNFYYSMFQWKSNCTLEMEWRFIYNICRNLG